MEVSRKEKMRKTIDLTKKDIQAVEDYQKRNGLKNFTDAMRNIVRSLDDKLSDDNFALIGDAIMKMDSKIDILVMHTAPKSAGEVK